LQIADYVDERESENIIIRQVAQFRPISLLISSPSSIKTHYQNFSRNS